MLGFAGVFILVLGKGELNFSGPTLAIIACTLATMSYGISANYTKRYLTGVHPMVLATMSQATAAIAMLPLAWYYWPSQPVSSTAWLSVTALGSVCTAFAYILFYGLISRIGPTRTVSVTFLVPVFAMLWGYLFLAEQVTTYMMVGCLVILIGTAFTIGLITPAKIRSIG
ncbi:DMT family transporter [Hahella ganghwensis]|uniref:DMT family transporter n=1 Tax=Hahella ganghwensis TaxID=286420 RepID=UPI00036916FB|nr:DMT family transporter [Hahella ganghwensis]